VQRKTYLDDWESRSVCSEHFSQLWPVRFAHQIVQVTLWSQENLQLFRRRDIPQWSAFLEEQIEEISALANCLLFLALCCGLSWYWRYIQTWEAVEKHDAKIVKVLESTATFDLSKRVSPCNRVAVVSHEPALLFNWIGYVQLHFSVICGHVKWLVRILSLVWSSPRWYLTLTLVRVSDIASILLVAEIFRLTPCCSRITASLGPGSTAGWGRSFSYILTPAHKGPSTSFSRNTFTAAVDTCKNRRELAKRRITYCCYVPPS